MSPQQILLIKNSFQLIKANSPNITATFYNNLFLNHPEIKSLFKISIEEQGKKLMDMITVAVNNVDNLSPVISAVQKLGKRHKIYGVKEEYYSIVGEYLLDSFEKELKENFTIQTKQAWKELYQIVANVMQTEL